MSDTFFSRYLAAWNSHRGTEVAEFMTDDVDFEDVTMGEHLSGKQAVAEFAQAFDETFSSDYVFTLVNAFSTDAEIGAEWTVSGTHDRSGAELPATGKPFTIRGATIARLRDGKIAYNRDYWDMAGFLGQVGLLPQAAG
jgi:steroid delta-isomerase-like uncharacterized protein